MTWVSKLPWVPRLVLWLVVAFVLILLWDLLLAATIHSYPLDGWIPRTLLLGILIELAWEFDQRHHE